jgi:MATE family multidrug resistance protein
VEWWKRTKAAWPGPDGGREVARLAYPLILGHLSFAVQAFVDRLFLTWYSPEAVAGAVTGLFAVWSVVALFTGTGEYLTLVLAWGAMLLPAWVGCVVLGAGVRFAWSMASLYVVQLGLLMRRRFRAGLWRTMRVIEPGPLRP